MDVPAVLTVEEAAARLRVGNWTIRAWIAEGKLRAVRPGRAYLIQVADIEALLASTAVQAAT
jgi:excisionase family DNA binding protein